MCGGISTSAGPVSCSPNMAGKASSPAGVRGPVNGSCLSTTPWLCRPTLGAKKPTTVGRALQQNQSAIGEGIVQAQVLLPADARLASVMKLAGRVLGQEVEPAQRQISSVYGALLARNQEECRDIPVLLIPHCPSRPADRGNCASRGAEAGGALGCDSLRILEHPLGELPVPTVSAFLKAASEPESPRLRSQPGEKKVCEELKCRKRRRSCAGRGRCPPLTEDPQCLGQRDCWPDARFAAGRGRS